MNFALTTRWNAIRHTDGQAMIEEILGLGFRHVELGYDLRIDLVPGVKKMVEQKAVTIESVHNFCPVPVGSRGHPELYTLASPDPRVREGAVHHTSKTIRFAAEVGARVVIVHAGNTDMKKMSMELFELFQANQQFSETYEKIKLKLQITREKKVKKQIEYLYQTLEQLVPVLRESRVRLALENLPTWEAIPTEMEAEAVVKHFGTDVLGYWHDIGHGQLRQNLGFINQERWLERLSPLLLGMHLHDVAPPAQDHLMPPRGQIDFSRLKRFAKPSILKVIEPAPDMPVEDIRGGLEFFKRVWGDEEVVDG